MFYQPQGDFHIGFLALNALLIIQIFRLGSRLPTAVEMPKSKQNRWVETMQITRCQTSEWISFDVRFRSRSKLNNDMSLDIQHSFRSSDLQIPNSSLWLIFHRQQYRLCADIESWKQHGLHGKHRWQWLHCRSRRPNNSSIGGATALFQYAISIVAASTGPWC